MTVTSDRYDLLILGCFETFWLMYSSQYNVISTFKDACELYAVDADMMKDFIRIM